MAAGRGGCSKTASQFCLGVCRHIKHYHAAGALDLWCPEDNQVKVVFCRCCLLGHSAHVLLRNFKMTNYVQYINAGLDWDELEEQARADDRERDFSDEDQEEFSRKRKSKGSNGGAGKKARR